MRLAAEEGVGDGRCQCADALPVIGQIPSNVSPLHALGDAVAAPLYASIKNDQSIRGDASIPKVARVLIAESPRGAPEEVVDVAGEVAAALDADATGADAVSAVGSGRRAGALCLGERIDVPARIRRMSGRREYAAASRDSSSVGRFSEALLELSDNRRQAVGDVGPAYTTPANDRADTVD